MLCRALQPFSRSHSPSQKVFYIHHTQEEMRGEGGACSPQWSPSPLLHASPLSPRSGPHPVPSWPVSSLFLDLHALLHLSFFHCIFFKKYFLMW